MQERHAWIIFFFGISVYPKPAKIMMSAFLWDYYTAISRFGIWKAIVSTRIFKEL